MNLIFSDFFLNFFRAKNQKMFTAFAVSALLVSSLAPFTRADPTPLAPGPGDVFTQGGDCTFSWTPDPTDTWKVMNIQLMTGSNFGMVHLTSTPRPNSSRFIHLTDCPCEQPWLPLTEPALQ
jgi:hypothetical protein